MPKNTIPADDTVIRPFADWLREQSSGKTHEELSVALHDLIGRVTDTGKKGSLQLTVTVAPMKGDVSMLVVGDEIKLRIPEHDRKTSIFYPDRDGNLSRRDPNQLEFESLREVPAGVNPETGEIREVGS